MKNKLNKNLFGEKLAQRTARRTGHSAIISIPAECIGRRYERYIDRSTGVITLIPAETQSPEPQGGRS